MSDDRIRRVLIVDDNAMIAEAIPHVLGHDFQTSRAVDGEAARDLLAAGAVFDAVLCDILMPRLDGLRLLNWARAHRPDIVPCFVFLTVAPEFPAAREIAQTHAVLRKPCTRSALLAAMGISESEICANAFGGRGR
jgi:CheY-like chemotaxis protein